MTCASITRLQCVRHTQSVRNHDIELIEIINKMYELEMIKSNQIKRDLKYIYITRNLQIQPRLNRKLI